VRRLFAAPRGAPAGDPHDHVLERLFLEDRRRSHTIPHAFGERAALKLMYAALQRASRTWQRLAISDFERKQ
jgi:transposase-like protein